MFIDTLRGMKVLVTGGSRGIGAACVRTLSDLGCVAGFTYLGSEDEARKIEKYSPGNIHAFRADTTDREAMGRVIKDLDSIGGPGIDGLVVNAGVYHRKMILDMTVGDWRTTLGTNLDGAFIAVTETLPFMDRGSIVMISSQLAFKGSGMGADYAASKAGILGLSRSLARELAPGIRVNTISPGFIDTDILAGDSDKKRKARIEEVPLGRIGTPDDVARVVAFLLSDLSDYMTGANIDVNGGLYIH